MIRLINIPIEPIEERYSMQWDKWFKWLFETEHFSYTTIYGGKTSGTINRGSFLDVVETNKYKNNQMSQILNILGSYNDEETLVLFFHDLWFPGLEQIAYIREGLGLKNLRICGCLHAGSYDEFDFLNKRGMTGWAKYMELGWFNYIADAVFVATEFHKKLLMSSRIPDRSKIFVTGFPLYGDFVARLPDFYEKRKPIITFPHRLDSEKNPDQFDRLAERKDMQQFQFNKTVKTTDSKKGYYNALLESFIAVSFADQETWGIAMQEATLCGAFPLVPRRLSYEEMYLSTFLYDTYEEAVQKIKDFWTKPPYDQLREQQKMIVDKGGQAIPKMCDIIRML